MKEEVIMEEEEERQRDADLMSLRCLRVTRRDGALVSMATRLSDELLQNQ